MDISTHFSKAFMCATSIKSETVSKIIFRSFHVAIAYLLSIVFCNKCKTLYVYSRLIAGDVNRSHFIRNHGLPS